MSPSPPALVLPMPSGIARFYDGLVRSKHILVTFVQSAVTLCLISP